MKKKLKIAAWIVFVVMIIALVFATQNYQRKSLVAKPTIEISIVDENAFITETELLERLNRANLYYPNQKVNELHLSRIEDAIRKMVEVENVHVYKRLGGNWGVKLKVRQPYARVFNQYGESFYIDSKGKTMKPSPNFTARVLVISGNIQDKADTLTVSDIEKDQNLRKIHKLHEMYYLAKVIHDNSFLNAQISQIQRDKWGDFILIPRVGSQRIILGPAPSLQQVIMKLKKLEIFYEEGLPYVGWNKYKTINLKFHNQLVCSW